MEIGNSRIEVGRPDEWIAVAVGASRVSTPRAGSPRRRSGGSWSSTTLVDVVAGERDDVEGSAAMTTVNAEGGATSATTRIEDDATPIPGEVIVLATIVAALAGLWRVAWALVLGRPGSMRRLASWTRIWHGVADGSLLHDDELDALPRVRGPAKRWRMPAAPGAVTGADATTPGAPAAPAAPGDHPGPDPDDPWSAFASIWLTVGRHLSRWPHPAPPASASTLIQLAVGTRSIPPPRLARHGSGRVSDRRLENRRAVLPQTSGADKASLTTMIGEISLILNDLRVAVIAHDDGVRIPRTLGDLSRAHRAWGSWISTRAIE